jgi:hypothetical protein
VRFTRQNFGVLLLAVSLVYSALYLTGRFHPMWLRMRAHGGAERVVATVLGSLTLKAVVLVVAALMAFWPERRRRG